MEAAMKQIQTSSTFRWEKEILVKALQNNKELFRNLLKTKYVGKQGVEEKIAFKKLLQNAWPECSRVKTARSVMKTIAAL